jgi:hypothetical protein
MHKDVIDIDLYSFCQDGLSKNCIHHLLEHRGRVRESKEHNGQFKEPFIGDESCLPFVAFSDPHIVKPPSDVELCEVLVLLDAVKDF